MCVHFEYRLNSGRAIPEKTCPILGAKLGENRPSHLVDQCSISRFFEGLMAKTFPVDRKGIRCRR